MSRDEESNSKAVSGALALLAVILTAGGAVLGFKVAGDWAVVLGCAVLCGLILDALSAKLSPAGYFSLASPLALSIPLLVGEGGNPATGLPFVGLAVAVAGVSSFGRFAVEKDIPMGTKLAGLGVNVLRTAVVGGAMMATYTVSGFVLPAALVGFAVWMGLDAVVVNVVVKKNEDHESVDSWEEVLSNSRAVLALPAVGGALASKFLLHSSGNTIDMALGVLGVGMASFPFRGALMYPIDQLKVRDQEQLEMKLKTAEHHTTKIKEKHDDLSKKNKRLDDELKSVYDMARSLGASTQLEETVGIVLAMVRRLRIPFQSCVILLYRNGSLSPVLSDTPYADVLAMSHLLQLEESLIKEVVESRKPRLKPNLSASSEGRIFKDERSVMCVPLMVSKEIVGVIYVGSIKEGTHTEEHLSHLKMLSAFAAPSMKTAMLFEDKEKDLTIEREIREAVEAKNAQLAGLQQMGQRMGQSLKSKDTITVVAQSLKEMITAAQSVILFTPDTEGPDGHALKAEFAETPYSAYVKNLALRDDEGLLGKAISSKQTILVQDTEMFDVQNLLGSEDSVVVAPLLGGAGEHIDTEPESSELLGVLYVGSDKKNALTEEHRNIIETVSYQTAMALKNARLYEQTQQMALTDGLTGLYTHRLFQEKLTEEIEWASRHGEHIVLVMVDADNFKTYNDTLGHPAGDALLIEIANLLRDKVRSTDIVCRYGGDEFALLLKNTSKVDAHRMCERIREAFQLRFGGNEVQVTSSIGLACYPVDANSKKDLAKAADDALYMSKRGGRNRVSVSKTFEERHAPPIVMEVLART